jgi:hypothetical protein
MKLRNKILTIAFAMFMIGVGFTFEASAQRRVVYVRRPVVVRSYVYRDPFWYSRYYDPFYSSYYYDPYRQAREQQYYLQSRVAGNERELQKHLQKYRADGVITAKERRELDDDIRDVQKSRQNLRRYSRYY